MGYVQDNGLKGRTFASLEEQNQFLLDWERTVADTRLHGTTRHQVGKLFTEVERPLLQPLPRERFPFFHEGRRRVHRDGHVEVDSAYYSVPPEYLGRDVWVRWDARMVRVFNDRMDQIAVHPKHEPGRFSTDRRHIASEKITGVERGASWLLGRVRLIGPHSARWAEATIQARGVQGMRVVQGLLSLTHRHDWAAIEQGLPGRSRLRLVPAADDPRAHRSSGSQPGAVRVHDRSSDHSSTLRVRPVRARCVSEGGMSVMVGRGFATTTSEVFQEVWSFFSRRR